jgi:hypothetical protein
VGVEAIPQPTGLLLGQEPCYILNRRLDGPQRVSLGGSAEEKVSSPLGFEPWTVQPTLSHYTDCATPANLKDYGIYNVQNEHNRRLCLFTSENKSVSIKFSVYITSM